MFLITGHAIEVRTGGFNTERARVLATLSSNRGEDRGLLRRLLLLFQATNIRDHIINRWARKSFDRFHLALALGKDLLHILVAQGLDLTRL